MPRIHGFRGITKFDKLTPKVVGWVAHTDYATDIRIQRYNVVVGWVAHTDYATDIRIQRYNVAVGWVAHTDYATDIRIQRYNVAVGWVELLTRIMPRIYGFRGIT
ncbi:MAG: hypothetical protein F6K40_11840 [Okeania sp. SIO3I5]|uniref:hypothetical protein n=1 Tax=Okeania sp. SIO3I5 TaxID=2607805 RepID=UPI0013BD49E4|nr:hypothetical protein [Okeania sp. SIO3I5]NEQ36932.1 hypothetical protein [Okeania sp. SIO3I5]